MSFSSPKHPAFLFRQPEPPNGGPPPELMLRDFVTDEALFYVRNHGPTPSLDATTWRLHVGGLVGRELCLSLDDLRRDFAAHTVPATLQCAGNRRADLIRVAPIPGEVPWGGEAISHGEWTGARLADVLAAAGLDRDQGARHVEFLGLDHAEKEGKRYEFGGSIPLEKALAAETLLAYALNGRPLPTLHGFPVRAVVPGYIGARSVKWLGRIVVRADPSPNQFQAKQYRLYPAVVRAATADPAHGLPLGETAVNADVCRVKPANHGAAVVTVVEGWAIGGGGRAVARVEVSTDEGATWTQATLVGPDAGPWGWRFWRAELPAAPATIVARAWDTAANVQPEHAANLWNFKGYANNAWSRWPVTAGPETGEPVREIEYFI